MKYKSKLLNYRLSDTHEIYSLGELSEYYSKCFKAEYGQFLDEVAMTKVDTWLEGSVAEDMIAIDHADTVTMACMLDSELVGTVIFAERGDEQQRYVYVWGMYVHPDRLRAGIGSFLLGEVARSVSPDSRVEVSVVTQSTSAMRFYVCLGFRTYKSENVEVFPGVDLPIELMQCTTQSLLDLHI